jgi:hypothetical protein
MLSVLLRLGEPDGDRESVPFACEVRVAYQSPRREVDKASGGSQRAGSRSSNFAVQRTTITIRRYHTVSRGAHASAGAVAFTNADADTATIVAKLCHRFQEAPRLAALRKESGGLVSPACSRRTFEWNSSSETRGSELVRAGGLEHYARRSQSPTDSRSCNDHRDLRVVVFPSAPACSLVFMRRVAVAWQ